MPSPQGRDPEIWQRIDALLSEALTLPQSERESWLARLSRVLGHLQRGLITQGTFRTGWRAG
jgi:hypothetical protein